MNKGVDKGSVSEPSRLGWGFHSLVATQFLGAVNDHYLKMVVSLIAIEEGIRSQVGVQYLSISGMALILPYLLFSGFAGYLSDRFNKRSVLIWTTGIEFMLGFVVLGALFSKNIVFLIVILFVLGAQSVFFSPAKYGILPEMLPESNLSRANGTLELSRYIAIICGSVLGGAMMKGWSDRPLALASVVLVVTFSAWLTSFKIERVAYSGSKKRPSADPWREIRAGFVEIRQDARLRSLVAAITGFDFSITILLMNLLLLAKQTMHLDDSSAGLLAGTAGIGIGLGSWAVGRLSGQRVELAYVAIGAMGAGGSLILLAGVPQSFVSVATVTVIAAGFAGFVVVPLYTALQRRARVADRGTVIATNNFLNMGGVLVASAALWLLHDGLGLSPEKIFLWIGAIFLLLTVYGLKRARRMRMRLIVMVSRLGRSLGIEKP